MKGFKKEAIPVEHNAWLKQRSKGIGGSDAGTVMGVNEYKSAFTLWAEKTGQIDAPRQSSEAIRLGHDLEDYVAKRFCEAEGKRVKRSSFCFESKERPYMRANVDRLVIGENAVLECKTANMMKGSSYKKDEIPATYYYQCLHYMAVLGLDRVYLAVLVFSHGLYTFVIDRSDPQIQQDMEYLVQKEEEFWKHVEDGTRPEIDGSESTADTVAALYGREPEDAQSFLDLTEMTPDFERRALIKYGDKPATVVTAIGALEKRACDFPEFDGIKSGIIVRGQDGSYEEREGAFYDKAAEQLVGGWAEIKRKDRSVPTHITISLDEYVQRKGDGTINANWAGKPATMIRKCAKAAAYREAFPKQNAQLYDIDEVKAGEFESLEIHQAPAGQPDPQLIDIADPNTGEIYEDQKQA